MQSIHLVTRKKQAGFIPCIVYGKNQNFEKKNKKANIEKPYYNKEFSISKEELKILKSSKLKTRALPLEINFEDEGTQYKRVVIVKAVQIHPISNQIIHIDFFLVDNIQQFETVLPVRIIGKENSFAIKEGGVVNQMFKEIKAIRSHQSTTEEIIIDITNLKKRHSIRVSDINLTDITIKNNPVLVTIL